MIADEIALLTPQTTTSARCSSCRAIAELDPTKQAEIVSIFASEIRHPTQPRPFFDSEVATWLSANTTQRVGETSARDCRLKHYGFRRQER